jgi:hypothetical protein
MSRRNQYVTWLHELSSLRRRIEAADADREVPSKLCNLVTYATEEAAIQLQEARELEIPIDSSAPPLAKEN